MIKHLLTEGLSFKNVLKIIEANKDTQQQLDSLNDVRQKIGIFVIDLEYLHALSNAGQKLYIEELRNNLSEETITVVERYFDKKKNILKRNVVLADLILLKKNICKKLKQLKKRFEEKCGNKKRNGAYTTEGNGLIRWNGAKEILVHIRDRFIEEEKIPESDAEEFLAHFIGIDGERFTTLNPTRQINWLGSDADFGQLIDVQKQMNFINGRRFIKDYAKHFINRDGKQFKDLAQKRKNKDDSGSEGSVIKKIVMQAFKKTEVKR